MKKLFYILITALALAAFTSCEDGEGDVISFGNQDLSVVSAELLFGPDGGTNAIVVETSGTVKAVSDASWAEVSVNGKTINVTAGAYSEIETRYAKITISAGSESTSVVVQQSPVVVKDFNPEDIATTAKGGSYEIPYSANANMTVSSDVDWIAAESTTNDEGTSVLKIDVEPNNTVSQRTGSVSYAVGSIGGVIKVTQASSLVRTSNWTVSYEGLVKIDGKSNDDVLVTVGNEDTGAFAVVVESKSNFTNSGEKAIEDYIATSIYPKASTGTQYSATSHIYISPKLANDTYTAYVIGLKEGNAASGYYQYFDFTINREATPYEKLLGSWTIERQGGFTDTWTIHEDVEDESFLIEGIEGHAYSYFEEWIKASFDANTGELILKEQEILTYEDSEGDNVTVQLVGYINVNGTQYYWGGGDAILRIKANNDNTASIIPQSVYGTYQFTGMVFYGMVADSPAYWYCSGNYQTFDSSTKLTRTTASATSGISSSSVRNTPKVLNPETKSPASGFSFAR